MIGFFVGLLVVAAGSVVLGRWHERVTIEQALHARDLDRREHAVARREAAVAARERGIERAVARVMARARRGDPEARLASMVPDETAGPVWNEETDQ